LPCGHCCGLAVSTGTGGFGLHPVIGYFAGIAIALLFAFLSGLIVAKARIPAFIVTLGTNVYRAGLGLDLCPWHAGREFPEGFTYLGTQSLGPVPWTIVIFILMIAIVWYIMEKRPLGRYIYAVGSNEEAARAAGINVDM
jgi:ribose/xylose/arabinose/galactoside ABC-type transport system permease subunit